MVYRVLIPREPSEAVPRGAALLEVRVGEGRVLKSDDRFGEQCSQAIREGHRVRLPDDPVEIGYYDDTDGELNVYGRGIDGLGRWLGHPVSRDDLQARDNRTERRHRARSLTMRGRFIEAARLDKRMGL
jgi:hypothetical protein